MEYEYLQNYILCEISRCIQIFISNEIGFFYEQFKLYNIFIEAVALF